MHCADEFVECLDEFMLVGILMDMMVFLEGFSVDQGN